MSKIILLVVLLNTLVTFAGLFYSYTQNNASVAAQESVAEASDEAPRKTAKVEEFTFFGVEKIIATVPGEARDHYFVLDLVLYADSKTDPKAMEKVAPLVRNSVVSNLSAREFSRLRALPIAQLQAELEEAIKRDFDQLGVACPFRHVLISKLVVQ